MDCPWPSAPNPFQIRYRLKAIRGNQSIVGDTSTTPTNRISYHNQVPSLGNEDSVGGSELAAIRERLKKMRSNASTVNSQPDTPVSVSRGSSASDLATIKARLASMRGNSGALAQEPPSPARIVSTPSSTGGDIILEEYRRRLQ